MRKLQILFPEPQLRRLREIARSEDRPVSELVRIAVAAWLEKMSPAPRPPRSREVPLFHGGRILVESERLRDAAHDDRVGTGE